MTEDYNHNYNKSLEINKNVLASTGAIFRKWSDQKSIGTIIEKLTEEKKAAIDAGIMWKGNRFKPSCLVWKGDENSTDLYSAVTENGDVEYLDGTEYRELKSALNDNRRRHEAYFSSLLRYIQDLDRLDIAEKIYYGFSNEDIMFRYNLIIGEWNEEEEHNG